MKLNIYYRTFDLTYYFNICIYKKPYYNEYKYYIIHKINIA